MTMLHRTSLSFGPAAPAAAGENTENTYEFYFTKYGWIYIKQTQNDNLTSDPPSALLRAGA